MKRYINRKCLQTGLLETVEELEYNNKADRKYARYLLNEYRIADQYGSYYISQRPCKDW